MVESGYNVNPLGYALSWQGIIPEEEDAYDEFGKVSMMMESDRRIHVQDAIIILKTEADRTTRQMKEALMKYGALAIAYYHDDSNYNEETYAYYANETDEANHDVAVVGWDDTFSKDNFLIAPPSDGTWIIKNSYGTEFDDNGYFYLSYYDKSFMTPDNGTPETSIVGYIFENTIPYVANYQTDFTRLTGFNRNYTHYSNAFAALEDGLIGAVGTYFNESGIDYELKVYVNDELKHTQSGVSEYGGFKTIVLNRYIAVNADDRFRVEFKSNNVPGQEWSRYPIKNERSYVSGDGETWIDYAGLNMTVCLKVYIVDSRLNTSIISDKSATFLTTDLAKGTSRFALTLISDGEALKNKRVSITFNGKTEYCITDENGAVFFEIPQVKAGKYALDMRFEGDNIYNPSNASATVNVMKEETGICLHSAIFYDSEAKQVKVTLWDSKSKPIAGRTVSITVNGRTYYARTDENGEAYIMVNLEPGTYNATVGFEGDDTYLASNGTGTITVIPDASDEPAKTVSEEAAHIDSKTTGSPILAFIIVLLGLVLARRNGK